MGIDLFRDVLASEGFSRGSSLGEPVPSLEEKSLSGTLPLDKIGEMLRWDPFGDSSSIVLAKAEGLSWEIGSEGRDKLGNIPEEVSRGKGLCALILATDAIQPLVDQRR